MNTRLPLPFPSGWFRVCESGQLGVGEVRAVRYFGQELVLFRDEGGVAHVMDAYCRHLGAHLGYGGKVEGECIRCPFHAWLYDGSGRCVEIPYAKRIPPKAAIKAWPVCERNGMVMTWYHKDDGPPTWELPEVAEMDSGQWTDPVVRSWTVRSHPQEQMENIVDPAHFQVVHGTPGPPAPVARTDGHIFRVESTLPFTTPGGEIAGHLTIESHGFGLGLTRFSGIVDTLLVITGTSVEEDLHETVLRFMVKKMSDESITSTVGEAFIAEIERQYSQDIPIWENKTYLPRPLLCDGDGPIGQVRSWAKQFY
ncbi:MAG: Rieske 2Fe-2S domain-containing protein [Deltaproteobacteria bacterium]